MGVGHHGNLEGRVAPAGQQRGLLSLRAQARWGRAQGSRVSCSVVVSGQRPGPLLVLWELTYDSDPDLPWAGVRHEAEGMPQTQ